MNGARARWVKAAKAGEPIRTGKAPNGTRTVRLVDGPLAGSTARVPLGDDLFQSLDRPLVFGYRHERYARYTLSTPGGDEYRFTGEYWIRSQF